MEGRLVLLLGRLWRRPGIRITLFGGAALLATLLAPLIDRAVPSALHERFSRDAVLPILNILASSMLAVSTFSLGVMVQAFRAAASQATPRVYRILMQDMTTQNVLSIFVGSFLFSLSAIVMFRAGFYGETEAVVVFGMTIACILLIIGAILRWIAHLSQLGSLDHTLALVESATSTPLQRLAKDPHLGARSARDGPKSSDAAKTVLAPCSGYVQHINLAGLNTQLKEANSTLWVLTPPGQWALAGTPLARVEGDADCETLAHEFTLGANRTLEQDARFGMIILSEVASRALSPGVNDPGTAIDVIHRLERVLWGLGQRIMDNDPDDEVRYDRIYIGTVSASDLMQDGFAALMEDGGSRFDVMAQVIKATNRLAASDWSDLSDAAHDTQKTALMIVDRQIKDQATIDKLCQKAKAT